MRFCEYELEEMHHLTRHYGGFPPKQIVNIALEHLFGFPNQTVSAKCKKHKINFVIDEPLIVKLNEIAKTYSVRRSDLIRLAILNFKLEETEQRKDCLTRHPSRRETKNSSVAGSVKRRNAL